MQNVMIDLETLSTAPNARILSIGAVRFDESGRELYGGHEVFYATIQNPTGHIDNDTVRWWFLQEQAAREEVQSKAHMLTELDALHLFKSFFERVPGSLLWAWPATADEVWLRNCYLRNNFHERDHRPAHRLPWSHRDVRCARTLAHTLGLPKAEGGDSHCALDDARAQARQTSTILSNLRLLSRSAAFSDCFPGRNPEPSA